MKFVLLTAGLSLGLTVSGQITHRSTIELDGFGQYIEVPAHHQMNVNIRDSYSQTFWFRGSRTITYAPTQRILSHRLTAVQDSTTHSGYEVMALRNTAKNFVGVDLFGKSGTVKDGLSLWAPSVGRAELNEWHHAAVVLNRKTNLLYIYVDGKLQSQKTLPEGDNTWKSVTGAPTFIGCGTQEGKPFAFFGGQLDNIRFYKRALSIEEVLSDLSTEVADKNTPGLIAAFDFEDYRAGDTLITDNTGKFRANLHGQLPLTRHKILRTIKATKTNSHLVGRGNAQALLGLHLGLLKPSKLESMTLSLKGTTSIDDIASLKVYLTDNSDRYDHRNPGILLLEGTPQRDSKVVHLTPSGYSGDLDTNAKVWIVADIKPTATEGNKIVSRVESLELSFNGTKTVFDYQQSETAEHEIVLGRTLIWTPGENQSAHYRIPSLVRLDNGTLVAGIDKRKNSEYDLPEDINVEVKISHDNGRTWSKPITVAEGTPEHGYGDAAIATDGKTLHMVMVAGSGLWFYPSSASKPLEMYYTKSTDGGLNWEPVREITQEVYTDRYPNGGFFGSGNGIITRGGRIAFVAAMRTDAKWGGQMDNVMVYSDDNGKSWQSSPVARTNGDEAKILELSDGSLLISSRNRAYKMTPRTYVSSTDGGQTWTKPLVWEDLQGNACNAALARYSYKNAEGGKDIILHTLLESDHRANLKIYMSEDEGKTWPWSQTICSGEAAYSEIAILPDGTIGIISEENDRPGFDIYFTRVSIDWLRKGKNLYSK